MTTLLRTALSLALLLLPAATAGCRERAAPTEAPVGSDRARSISHFRLDALEVEVRSSPSAARGVPGSHAAAEKVRAGMVTAPGWAAGGSGERMRAEVVVQMIDEPGHERAIFLLFDAELRAVRPGVLPSPLRIERTRAMLRDAADTDRIDFELVDFGRLLADAASLVTGSDGAVLEGLVDARRELRLVAAREVEQRRLGSAVARLEELLDPADPEVFAAATSALVRVGLPSSTRVVVDRLDGASNPRLVTAVLPALPRLPGGEGTAYATMLASGHPDPSVRALAADVLTRPSGGQEP